MAADGCVGESNRWDCQEFRARLSGLTDQSMAAVKRSPKRTANCDLAMDHSRGGMIHSFSERFKTRKRSLVAASSLGKWPLARTARRSLAFIERLDSICGVENPAHIAGEGVERDNLAPGAPPALPDGRIFLAPEA